VDNQAKGEPLSHTSLRSEVKRVLRPMTRRFYTRVDARVDEKVAPLSAEVNAQVATNVAARLAAIEARLTSLGADVEAFSTYLPTVINTIATQNATDRSRERRLHAVEYGLESALSAMQRRMEFIRKELFFEQRYSSDRPGSGPSPEPKVVNKAKLDAMAGNLRVNLGAGHVTLDGYINVDARALPDIDITAEADNLPFGPGEIDELYSAHMLEHFPVEELRRTLLPYWVSLLKPGGTMVAVVPDIETMVTERAAGRMPFDEFREVVYGGQEYEGDFHFNGFSPESLTELLEEAGLRDVVVRESGRRNGFCYEMELEAVRAADPTD
jgi:hypothetical protein